MLRFCFALCLTAQPASAECRLALALAVDVSRSVDAADYIVQTEGLALALEDKAVQAAIFSPEGEVALAVYYWSGIDHQEVVVPWVVLAGPGELAEAVAKVRAAERPARRQPTALGYALTYGADLMAEAPVCGRRVLDVAGDGRNNEGISVRTAYKRADFGDIVVNGLAIGEHEADVVNYYRTEVIRGIGAFVEVAAKQKDYPRAIRRKLLRELNGPEISDLPAEARPRG
jgi:hypothetical protein